MNYKFIDHTADIQFEAKGKDLEELFSSCAYALKEVICPQEILGRKKIKIEVRGEDLESLLYNFLEEFLVLFDSEHFLLSKILDIKIDGKNLTVEIIGDVAKNYGVEMHVKAITYNEMKVIKKENYFLAIVTLDI